jgi:hypothetical protein
LKQGLKDAFLLE